MRLRQDGVATREVGGKTMILDLTTSTYFAVGGVGTLILGLLQSVDRTEDELVDALAGRFTVEPERLRTDVAAFIQRLDEAGLLVR